MMQIHLLADLPACLILRDAILMMRTSKTAPGSYTGKSNYKLDFMH